MFGAHRIYAFLFRLLEVGTESLSISTVLRVPIIRNGRNVNSKGVGVREKIQNFLLLLLLKSSLKVSAGKL